MIQRFHTVAVKGGKLLLDCGEDDAPELVIALELVLSNHPESVGDLEVSHVLAVLLEHEHKGICGLRATKSEVNLVEDKAPVVMEVIVSTCMYHTDGHLSQLDSSSESMWA